MTRLPALWLAGVLALTLQPVAQATAAGAHPRLSMLLLDLIANVALFVPLGVLAPGRRTAVAGLLLSIAIELTQRHLPGRTPSVLDVAANALGVVAGILFSPALLRLARMKPLRLLLPLGLFAVPWLGKLSYVCPFASAMVGGLGGAGLLSRLGAGGLGMLSGILACAILGQALEPGWFAASAAGAALVFWGQFPIHTSRALHEGLAIGTDS